MAASQPLGSKQSRKLSLTQSYRCWPLFTLDCRASQVCAGGHGPVNKPTITGKKEKCNLEVNKPVIWWVIGSWFQFDFHMTLKFQNTLHTENSHPNRHILESGDLVGCHYADILWLTVGNQAYEPYCECMTSRTRQCNQPHNHFSPVEIHQHCCTLPDSSGNTPT